RPVPAREGEVLRQGTARAQEPGPRHGAIAEVGREPCAERPALEMRYPRGGNEADAKAGLAQAVPELDVLDRGTDVALVEPRGGLEGGAADGAASRPERRGLGPRPLVDEMMGEVLVEADGRARRRLVVIGAEDGGQVRARKGHGRALEGLGPDRNVGVEEDDGAPGRRTGPAVAGGGRSGRPVVSQDARAEGRGLRCRGVARAVVRDDEL